MGGLIDLPALGVNLHTLKPIVAKSSLLITNDTGARHIAAALGVPVVTVFGPTDPAWSEINFPWERQVHVDVYCRPCQKKNCPLGNTPDDHQCMTMIDAHSVFQQATDLLNAATDQSSPTSPLITQGHATV